MATSTGENLSLPDTALQRPFPGLRSFEEKNKSQFGGRDAEIKELFSLVESHRLTINQVLEKPH